MRENRINISNKRLIFKKIINEFKNYFIIKFKFKYYF